MSLSDFGYNNIFDAYLKENGIDKSNIGRISAVYRNRFKVLTENFEISATLTGNFVYSAISHTELPTVGDWVHLNIFDDDTALITDLLPRQNHLERRAAGKESESQLIAANIDYGFIVEAVDKNFKLNRIERYLAICNSSDIEPIIIITKTDLGNNEDLTEILTKLRERLNHVQINFISNVNGSGIKELASIMVPGKTYCMLGMSGVGKSTLINNLLGMNILKTARLSNSTNKGIHTTIHRELFVLKNGGIVIDNPGMREIGLTDAADNIDSTFRQISDLSRTCRFSNCTHTHEKGCAILEAIKTGIIEQAQFDNYQKMKREQFHYSATAAEKRTKDKQFGKMVKIVKKSKPRKRY